MQNQKINDWINAVCSQIPRISYRNVVKKELKAHIEDRIRQLENEGMNHEQAVKRALCMMGDAEKVGKALAKCNYYLFFKSVVLNILIWTAVIILFLYLIRHVSMQ